MRIYVTEFAHNHSPASFKPGMRFAIESVELGAGGHSLQRVILTAVPNT